MSYYELTFPHRPTPAILTGNTIKEAKQDYYDWGKVRRMPNGYKLRKL